MHEGKEEDMIEALDSYEPKTLATMKDGGNSSLLHKACFWGRPTSARALIERGADLNLVNNTGFTPLRLALEWGKDEVAFYSAQGWWAQQSEGKMFCFGGKTRILMRSVDESRRARNRAEKCRKKPWKNLLLLSKSNTRCASKSMSSNRTWKLCGRKNRQK